MGETKLTAHEPDWQEVVRRRFGSRHEKPCARPDILTCAAAKCQIANRCRYNAADPAGRAALSDKGRG